MRHDLWLARPLSIAPSAPRMREAPRTAALVALAGLAQRLAPCRPCALAPAVALAAVAAAAHQHFGAAACAGERPGAVLRVALPSSSHARLAAKASTREGAATCTWTCAGCHTARALALYTSGARRLEQLARSSRVAALVPSKDRFYRVLHPNPRSQSGSRRPATTRQRGAGAQPQYKPSSIKPASGSDLRTSTRQPRNPTSRGLAPAAARLQCLHPSTPRRVSFDEQAWVNFDERQ